MPLKPNEYISDLILLLFTSVSREGPWRVLEEGWTLSHRTTKGSRFCGFSRSGFASA